MIAERGRARARMPAAAGAFYPADPEELASAVDRLLADAMPPPGSPARPAALIVPHAGFAYSGPVAASAYSLLRGEPVRRVALLGPAHFVPLAGAAVSGLDRWRTPLGDVVIDSELRDAALRAGGSVDDAVHEPEHSIEVQLPFLQRIWGSHLTFLPVAVGRSEPAEVAALIEALAGEALVVVSTDLSHYHDAETARRLDGRTAEAVLARDPAIGQEDACGVWALRGLVELARRRHADVRLLDLRNSSDTAGDAMSVVGYGAFALTGLRGPRATFPIS